MQQLLRTCQVADHYFKAIEYVCIYPECQMNRFLCSKCTLGTSHQHNQSNNLHIMDSRDFYEKTKNNLSQSKRKQYLKKYVIEKSIAPLKQLIQEISVLMKNIQNITQQIEQGKFQNVNINHLENELENIQKYGFNQIDDQTLNNLISIPEQQQDYEIYKQLEDQASQIILNAQKIKEWHLSQGESNQKSLFQKIKDAKYQKYQIDDLVDKYIYSGAVSNDLMYIVSGGMDKLLKIWNYQSNKLIKEIKFNNNIYSSKFTEDSTILYAGSHQYIYQFDVNNLFKELYKQDIHTNHILNIYCVTNTIILTSSLSQTIIITDVNKKQQLLKIQAHNESINGLDYNKGLNVIASGSDDKSIRLWNGNDGSLILEKLNAHNNDSSIKQVLFVINNNQLISVDTNAILIIWNMNQQKKQLEKLKQINSCGVNISLVLQQQYILVTGNKSIKIYSIKGEFVKEFDHGVELFDNFNTIQHDSMKAVLIQEFHKLQICKIDMD